MHSESKNFRIFSFANLTLGLKYGRNEQITLQICPPPQQQNYVTTQKFIQIFPHLNACDFCPN